MWVTCVVRPSIVVMALMDRVAGRVRRRSQNIGCAVGSAVTPGRNLLRQICRRLTVPRAIGMAWAPPSPLASSMRLGRSK